MVRESKRLRSPPARPTMVGRAAVNCGYFQRTIVGGILATKTSVLAYGWAKDVGGCGALSWLYRNKYVIITDLVVPYLESEYAILRTSRGLGIGGS